MNHWPAGTGLVRLAQTDSTNAEALRRAAAGTALPFWVTAEAQTAGRGRRGRAWVSQPGNFYGSLALDAGGDPAAAALRSFSASLALADALDGLGIASGDIALKWPNDVLVQGRKVAGILLESTMQKGRLVLVIGIGVNLAATPHTGLLEAQAVPPVSLAELGCPVSPADFLDRLAPALAAREDRFRREGFAPLRAEWLARCAKLGEEITARLPDREFRGRFVTVDDSGAVVLDTPGGRHHLPAAEIFF